MRLRNMKPWEQNQTEYDQKYTETFLQLLNRFGPKDLPNRKLYIT